jgi:hypothetical protein
LLDVFKSVRRHLAFLSFVVGASLTAVKPYFPIARFTSLMAMLSRSGASFPHAAQPSRELRANSSIFGNSGYIASISS